MKNQQTRKELLLEIIRFLIVGVIATVCDYATFCLFDAVVFPLFPINNDAWRTVFLCISTALGFVVGLILNWVLSVRFVFLAVKGKEKTRSGKKFTLFSVIALVGFVLTEIGVVVLVAVFPEIPLFGKTSLFGTGWEKWLAKCIMTCIVLVWNYLARKFFVFRP